MRVHRIPTRDSKRRRRTFAHRIVIMEKILAERFRVQGFNFSPDAAGELAAATLHGYYAVMNIINNSRATLFHYIIPPEDLYLVEKLELLVTSEEHIVRGRMIWGLMYNSGPPGNEPSEDEVYLTLRNYSATLLRSLL